MPDKFKLYKKWFWIGIAIGFLNVFAGVIYSVAMITEPEHRKEGLIILVWTLAIFLLAVFLLGPLARIAG